MPFSFAFQPTLWTLPPDRLLPRLDLLHFLPAFTYQCRLWSPRDTSLPPFGSSCFRLANTRTGCIWARGLCSTDLVSRPNLPDSSTFQLAGSRTIWASSTLSACVRQGCHLFDRQIWPFSNKLWCQCQTRKRFSSLSPFATCRSTCRLCLWKRRGVLWPSIWREEREGSNFCPNLRVVSWAESPF